MDERVVSRESLYAQLWAEPMIKVAPRYGLSDRGLAKICEARNIPVPPRGYWAKLAHGKRVKQVPLPPAATGDDGRIYFQNATKPLEPKSQEPLPPEIEFERQPESEIAVLEHLGKLHPLVARTQATLKTLKPSDRGLVHPYGECLDICVSPPLRPRALRIMQALVAALDARGYTVALDKEKRTTITKMLGEKIAFRLLERAKQVPAQPNDYRWKYVKEGLWSTNEPVDLVPSGVLVFEIGSGYRRAAIEDGKGGLLEDRLNDFLVKLLKEAFKQRKWREDRERAEAEYRERQRLQAIEDEKRRKEEEKSHSGMRG